jgi:hypothetical protein
VQDKDLKLFLENYPRTPSLSPEHDAVCSPKFLSDLSQHKVVEAYEWLQYLGIFKEDKSELPKFSKEGSHEVRIFVPH